jgi:hypothetical protein
MLLDLLNLPEMRTRHTSMYRLSGQQYTGVLLPEMQYLRHRISLNN